MATPLTRRPEGDSASPQAVPAASGPAQYVLPATLRDIGAQVSGALGLLTGVWVALSRGSSRSSTRGATPPPWS
jgi:hypothetical protein